MTAYFIILFITFIMNIIMSSLCLIKAFNIFYIKKYKNKIPSDSVPFLIAGIICSLVNYLQFLNCIGVSILDSNLFITYLYTYNNQVIFSICQIFLLICLVIFITKNLKLESVIERVANTTLYLGIILFLFSIPAFMSGREFIAIEFFDINIAKVFCTIKSDRLLNTFFLISYIIFSIFLYLLLLIVIVRDSKKQLKNIYEFLLNFILYFTSLLFLRVSWSQATFSSEDFILLLIFSIVRFVLFLNIYLKILNGKIAFDTKETL